MLRRRLVVLLAALMVIVVGCGGCGDDEASSSSSAGDSSSESSSESSDDGDGGSTDFAAAFGTENCTAAIGAAAAFSNPFLSLTSGQSAEYEKTRQLVDEMIDNAPDELADDLELIRDTGEEFAEALRDAGALNEDGVFDVTKLSDPEVAAKLDGLGDQFEEDDYQAAVQHLQTFLQTECGVGGG